MKYLYIALMLLAGCETQFPSEHSNWSWEPVNSPKPGYECYYHRSQETHRGYESTVCFPLQETELILKPIAMKINADLPY